VNGVVINNDGIGRVPVAPHAGGLTVGGETASGDDNLLVTLQITPSWSNIVHLESVGSHVSPARPATGNNTRSGDVSSVCPCVALCLVEALKAQRVTHGCCVVVGVLVRVTSVVACAGVRTISLKRIVVHQVGILWAHSNSIGPPSGHHGVIVGN